MLVSVCVSQFCVVALNICNHLTCVFRLARGHFLVF